MFKHLSVGRRRTAPKALVAMAIAGLLASLLVTSAMAVHDSGYFQLDGNAQTSVNPAPTALEDWDKVCPANSPANRPVGDPVRCLGGTTAQRSAFIVDAFLSASDNIYKGGTDDADVDSWAWKQAGPSPDKDDIEHAYAAQYIATTGPESGHKLLFFGGDRLANTGSTNIGLWFFHNDVTTGGTKAVSDGNGGFTCAFASGCGFAGLHTVGNKSLGGNTPGDLFILSAFTNGGAQPNIKVFEWVGPGNATKNYLGSNGCFTSACTMQPLAIPNTPGFTDNRCDAAASLDVACAVVNATVQPSPWTFKDKTSGAPLNQFGVSELYEGGLDLTGLGFGDACFSSTLLNTRSSPSGTSALQDFALGKFGSCTSTLTTTASVGASGVSIGGGSVSVTDSASLDVQGVSTWTGNLKFYICGPIASGVCSASGYQVGPAAGVTVTNATSQPISSASVSLTSAGRYCWYSKFTSNTTGVPDATDDGSANTPNTECFTVNKVTPALDTVAVLNAAGDPIPAGYKTPFGSPVYDTATLTGAAKEPGTNGTNATYPSIAATNGQYAGKITFALKGPDGGSPACSTTNTTGTGTNPQDVNIDTALGNKTYGPVSFITGTAGNFHWVATYVNAGSANNTAPAAHNADCSDADEAVVVQRIATQITTAPFAYPNDTATITSSVATDTLGAGGTVTFRLFGATGGATPKTSLENCLADTGTGTSSGLLYSVGKALTGGLNSESVGTNQNTVAVSTDSTVYWRVTYAPTAGDTLHTGIQSNCVENTVFDVGGDAGPGTTFPAP